MPDETDQPQTVISPLIIMDSARARAWLANLFAGVPATDGAQQSTIRAILKNILVCAYAPVLADVKIPTVQLIREKDPARTRIRNRVDAAARPAADGDESVMAGEVDALISDAFAQARAKRARPRMALKIDGPSPAAPNGDRVILETRRCRLLRCRANEQT